MAQTAAQKKAAADLAKLKAAIAKTQARVTENDAALDAAEKAATASRRAVIDTAPTVVAKTSAERAAEVTAARLASSPIAQEAARTTAALKSFTAKGGLLGVPGSNLPGYKPPTVNPTFNPVVNPVVNPVIPDTTEVTVPSTNITVLKSLLKGMGFNSSIIDSSTSFLMSLLAEDLDYDNAVSIFLDSKDYTLKSGVKITSPFYEQYGYLNEGMTNAKSASELYNFVEGSKGIIEKYGLSSKFLSQDSLKKYVKNNVTAKDLDERANAARLKAINADPLYVQSLKMLGYLGSNADLTDFYLDPAIGKEKLESNRSTGAFTAEALRRANAGIKTDREDMMRFERLTAGLQAKGLTEAEISQTASTGFQNIANTLQPEVALSNIFEGANAANAQTIQTELEAEEFLGLDSARRKKLKELGTNIMQAKTGMSTGRTVSYSNYSSAGQI